MDDKSKQEPKADDLVKPVDPESIELTEEDLERVSGGAQDKAKKGWITLPAFPFDYDGRSLSR